MGSFSVGLVVFCWFGVFVLFGGFLFCFLKFIMRKLLPYVSDALFDTLNFSDFPQLFIYLFLKLFKQDEKVHIT